MAGPLGMIRVHDTRDWAQRQAECHNLHAHGAPLLRDAWWQMHCRRELAHPPQFELEPRLRDDKVLGFLERTWMAQQIPWALLFWLIDGLPWLIWGVHVRVAVESPATGSSVTSPIGATRKDGASTTRQSRAMTYLQRH